MGRAPRSLEGARKFYLKFPRSLGLREPAAVPATHRGGDKHAAWWQLAKVTYDPLKSEPSHGPSAWAISQIVHLGIKAARYGTYWAGRGGWSRTGP